jgi:hypothetical protein
VALVIAAVVVGRTVLARGPRSARVSVGLIAFLLVQAGFAAFLHYWNLLGYRL